MQKIFDSQDGVMLLNKQSLRISKLGSFILKINDMQIKNKLIFLMIMFSIASFDLYAATFSVTCTRWVDIEPLIYKAFKLHSGCYLEKYVNDGVSYSDYRCKFGERCAEWRVTVNAESLFNELSSGTLYNKVIGSILDNKTNFRDHIINMLDTVTLQKIYDPNNVSH